MVTPAHGTTRELDVRRADRAVVGGTLAGVVGELEPRDEGARRDCRRRWRRITRPEHGHEDERRCEKHQPDPARQAAARDGGACHPRHASQHQGERGHRQVQREVEVADADEGRQSQERDQDDRRGVEAAIVGGGLPRGRRARRRRQRPPRSGDAAPTGGRRASAYSHLRAPRSQAARGRSPC